MPKHSSGHHSINGKNFIILPICFCAVIYLIVCLAVLPAASTYLSLADMFFSDTEKNFSSQYENIFVPVEESTETNITGNSSNETKSAKETVSISSFTFPSFGNQFGELIIEDCQVNAKLFFGDDTTVLSNGVGIYNGSSIPGYGKTILIAGHNNTYFNGLKYAKKGQIIKIRTNYGNYQYEITDIQVKDCNDSSAYDLAAENENLILYTCYPFDELGLTPLRCFVYAKPVSGPVIDKNS